MKGISPKVLNQEVLSGQRRNVGATEDLASLNWDLLFSQTLRYATFQVDRLRWRGDWGGVLPFAHDANSIAAEAFLELLRSDLPFGSSDPLPELRRRLRRLVHRQVDRLWRRKENFLVRNEPDLPLLINDDGEPVSIVETIPAPDADPAQTLVEQEKTLRFDAFKQKFDAFLSGEARLRSLFRCLCAGTTTPKAIGAKLNLTSRAVETLKKRLRRRASLFLHNGPRIPKNNRYKA